MKKQTEIKEGKHKHHILKGTYIKYYSLLVIFGDDMIFFIGEGSVNKSIKPYNKRKKMYEV